MNSPFLYRIVKTVAGVFVCQRGILPDRPEHFTAFGATWIDALPAALPTLELAQQMLGLVERVDSCQTAGEVVFPVPRVPAGPTVTA
jgi:hypothetical protein